MRIYPLNVQPPNHRPSQRQRRSTRAQPWAQPLAWAWPPGGGGYPTTERNGVVVAEWTVLDMLVVVCRLNVERQCGVAAAAAHVSMTQRIQCGCAGTTSVCPSVRPSLVI